MASWGYRVYTFELLSGQETLAQEIPQDREHLIDVLDLVGKQTRVGKPHGETPEILDEVVDADDSSLKDHYTKTEPTLTIRNRAYDSALGVIHASIALGERGLHDYAVNPEDGTDRVPVSERSAETPRRVDVFFATSQFEGLLVAEVVGMKDPLSLLVPWIRKVSSEQLQSATQKNR